MAGCGRLGRSFTQALDHRERVLEKRKKELEKREREFEKRKIEFAEEKKCLERKRSKECASMEIDVEYLRKRICEWEEKEKSTAKKAVRKT